MNEVVLSTNNEVGNLGELKTKIENKIIQFQTGVKYSTELQDKVTGRIAGDIVLERIRYDYTCSKVNIDTELSDFISTRSSVITGQNYQLQIQKFLDWCRKSEIEPVKIDKKGVDSYLVYLMSTHSNSSTITIMRTLCSFYRFMLFRNLEVFKYNPFDSITLPRKDTTNKRDIVTKNDISLLCKELNKNGRKEVVCAVEIMSKYGYRVGVFENMTINSKGEWSSISKGSECTGKFTKKETQDIINTKLCGVSPSILMMAIKRSTTKLYESGEIGCSFSPHDLRHYCITKQVKDSGADKFVKVSRKFHKNINTTMAYIDI